MAKTAFATDNLGTKKVWEERLYRDAKKESYFDKFMGSGSDVPVTVNDAFTKEQGDEITVGIRMRLEGDGVEEGQILEGNEESLKSYTCKILLHQYRHAVRDDGAMSRQRAMFSIDEESKAAIKDWMSEKVDALAFAALLADHEKNFYKTSAGVLSNATPATAKAALSLADSKISLQMISYLKAYAKTGGARTYVPMRPVKVKGKEYFVLLVHPDVMYDLKSDTAYQQAQREAQDRGSENPLFTGAAAIWDGVVIHEHESVTIGTNAGGASVPYAKCAFFGAQALAWAWGRRPKVIQKSFDFENENAYAIDVICGVKRPLFNSLTYGSLAVWFARTNVAGS
jgi:N4-gp56 family major capsid protein